MSSAATERLKENGGTSADFSDGITRGHINQVTLHHNNVLGAETQALKEARKCGDLLLAMKKKVRKDGDNWEDWLRANIKTIKDRTARVYMRIARNWPKLEQVMKKDKKHLSINAAEKLLKSKKSKPQKEVNEIDEARGTVKKVIGQLTDDVVIYFARHHASIIKEIKERAAKELPSEERSLAKVMSDAREVE